MLLHEYGHVALGHLNPMQTHNISLEGKQEVELKEYSRSQLAEFEADKFAVEHAIRGQDVGVTFPVEHFGLAIGLIYRFFDLCEALGGSSGAATTHPPGITRESLNKVSLSTGI